jgi:hypothetical protein
LSNVSRPRLELADFGEQPSMRYSFGIQGLGGGVQLFRQAASSSRHRFHILLVEYRQFEQACPFDVIVEAP